MPIAAMQIGLGTAIAGTAAAGAAVAGAKMNSNASKDAAKIQADSAQKALDERKRLFDIETANRAPYLAASQKALGELGNRAAPPPMAMPSSYQNPYAPKSTAAPMGSAPMLGQMGQMTPRQGGMQPQGQPMQGSPMTPQNAQQPAGGDLVTVQAPNGQTARLPRQQADMAVQKGARIVS